MIDDCCTATDLPCILPVTHGLLPAHGTCPFRKAGRICHPNSRTGPNLVESARGRMANSARCGNRGNPGALRSGMYARTVTSPYSPRLANQEL